MNTIRTRFAPSPTGYVHVGSIRTALFGWLLARKNNGRFILRIEDTDQSREVKGSIEHIIKSLTSLGLNYDEGPDIGGDYGPYIQSQRLDIYNLWAQKLVDNGLAYSDPYSEDELENFREQDKKNKQPFLFRNFRPNKLTAWDKNKALRFKSNPKNYTWDDLVMGKLSATDAAIDDFILIKSDGFPTYNFAHIIDDYLMQISHIIRGQEFIASTPKYLNLYEALDITPPKFATVPSILGPDGKKKLSKRDNARDVLEYLDEGFLKEPLLSFLASLGWNDGSSQEIYTVKELINKFSFSKVQKSPAIFDHRKLVWMNGSYLRSLSLEELYNLSTHFWPAEAQKFDNSYRLKVLSLLRDRLKYLDEIKDLSWYFFKEPDIDPKLISENPKLNTLSKDLVINLLTLTMETLKESDFSLDDLTLRLNDLLQKTNQSPSILFSLIRIAITQSPFSPGLFETIEVLGQEKTILRLKKQIEFIN